MTEFNWDELTSEIFEINNIENKFNADILFVSFLMEVEKRNIDCRKQFTIAEVVNLIPKGTAGIKNGATYGFSILSMLSYQKKRKYFIFKNQNLHNMLTEMCSHAYGRDNYYWKTFCLDEIVKINPHYIKDVAM